MHASHSGGKQSHVKASSVCATLGASAWVGRADGAAEKEGERGSLRGGEGKQKKLNDLNSFFGAISL